MTAPRIGAAALFSIGLAALAPQTANAEVPYDGWRGTTSSARPSYAGADYGSRPFDGTPRTLPPYSGTGLVSAPTPVYRKEKWTGFYAGANLGGAWGTVYPSGLSSNDMSLSGVTGGIHGGYNYQLGSFVAGIEADGSWLNADATRIFSDTVTAANARLDWTATLRGRLGYAWDNLLVYGTAGYALGGLGLDVASAGFSSSHERVGGFVYGGGLEMKVTPQLSIRAEALRFNFNEEAFATSAGMLNVGTDVTTVRAGVSWHFN